VDVVYESDDNHLEGLDKITIIFILLIKLFQFNVRAPYAFYI
jgi:hypothetical protein